MFDALMRSNPKPVHTIELDGKSFVFECDIDALRKGIESLRNEFDGPYGKGLGPRGYGYHYYKKDPNVDLTEEEYQENIDKFLLEFEKRLTYKHVEKVVKKAVKKKDGTFAKRRVYNEYVLRNAEDNGMGKAKIYKLKYEVVDDLRIRLIIHYTSEAIDYRGY